MFVVIKQSLFDQELSDTECVQALGLVVKVSTKTTKTLLLAKFSLLELALHQQLFIRRFLGTAPPPPLGEGDLQLCSSSYSSRYTSLYLTLPHYTSSLRPL